MKAACAKCAAMDAPALPKPQPTPPPLEDHHKLDGITDPENTIYANQQSFDADKLHQAILAFRPVRQQQNHPTQFIILSFFLQNPVPSPSYRPIPSAPGYYPGYPTPYPGPMYFTGYQQPAYGPAPYGLPFFNPAYVGSQRTSVRKTQRPSRTFNNIS